MAQQAEMTAAKLKELEAKATEGPWTIRKSFNETDGVVDPITWKSPGFYDNLGIYSEASDKWPIGCSEYDVFESPHDMLLIAYLRNHAEQIEALVRAAECIRHWHDSGKDGMVVSAEHVHKLWEALAALDKDQS